MKIKHILSHLLVIAIGAAVGDYLPVLNSEIGGQLIGPAGRLAAVQFSALLLWLLWNGYSIVLARLTDREWRDVRTVDSLTYIPLFLLLLYSRNHMINEQFFGVYYGLAYPCMVGFLTLILKFAHVSALVGKSRWWAVAALFSSIAGLSVTIWRMDLGLNLFTWLEADVFIALQLAIASIFSIVVIVRSAARRRYSTLAEGFIATAVFIGLFLSFTSPEVANSLPPPSSIKSMKRAMPLDLFKNGGSAGRVRANIGGEIRDALVFPVPGKVSDTVNIEGATLSFGVGVVDFDERDDSKATVELNVRVNGASKTAWSVEIDPVNLPADRRWRDFSIDLSPYARATGEASISFDVKGRPWLAVSRPVITHPEEVDGSKLPNIIMIVIDTLRSDHVGVYGYGRNTTPVIDSLARNGVVFKNAVSTAPWTEPATFSLLTGMLPGQVDAGLWSRVILAEEPDFIGEHLRRRGYRTAAISGNYIITHALNFDQGFETFDETCHPWFHWRSASCMTDRALEWAERDNGEPYLLYMHYVDPHARYNAPPPYREMFSMGYVGDDPRIARGETVEFEIRYERAGKKVELSDGDRRYMEELYDGEIAYSDAEIGRLLDDFRRRGLLENTVIIITSDHGEEFTEHGMLGHRLNLHGTLLDVPLIFYAPGLIPEGVVVDETVSLADVTPTVLNLLDIAVPKDVWGRSLQPLWRGESLEPRVAFAQRRQLYLDEWTVTDGDFKLILGHTKKQGVHNPRFYNLDSDPVELRNITGDSTGEGRLRGEIERTLEWIGDHKFRLPGFAKPMDKDDFRKRMEALGYVQ